MKYRLTMHHCRWCSDNLQLDATMHST